MDIAGHLPIKLSSLPGCIGKLCHGCSVVEHEEDGGLAQTFNS